MVVRIIKIGSEAENDVQIKHDDVSEFHARISINDENEVYITNVDTAQKTFVNDTLLSGLKQLYANDKVRFGDYAFDWEAELAETLKDTVKEPKPKDIPQSPSQTQQDQPEYVRPKSDGLLDELETDFIEEDQRRAAPENAGPVAQMVHRIQYPENRAKQHRIWILVLSILMLLTIGLPVLGWHNGFQMFSLKPNDSGGFSAAELFLELIEIDSPEAFVVSMRYLLVIAAIPVVTISALLLFLIGIKAWQPKSGKTVKGLGLTILITLATVIFSQWFWYLAMIDGPENLTGSNEALRYLSYEHFGIGFWICVVASLLVYRSANNGLWRPETPKKWLTLSVSFWMPIVMLMAFTSSYFGFMAQEIDMGDFNKGPMNVAGKNVVKEEVQHFEQSGAMLLSGIYYTKAMELSKSAEDKGKAASYLAKEQDEKRDKISNYSTILWFTLNTLLVCMIMMLFGKTLIGNKMLALAITSFVVLIGTYFALSELLSLRSQGSLFVKVEMYVGLGFFIAAAACLAMIVELIVIRSKAGNKNDSIEV